MAFHGLILSLLLLCSLQCILANVEKTVFLGPEIAYIPQQSPSLYDLHVDVLTPSDWSLRTHVEAIFPDSLESSYKGKSTWLLLDNLTDSQRYEVRICWVATQPTAFTLETYELSTVFEDPELITSLYEYSMSRQTQDTPNPNVLQSAKPRRTGEREASVLLMHIQAAADYFTTNKTLMTDVPPVYVDIILDPFLLNVLPRTLLPTAGCIVLVAVVSFFLARRVMPWVRDLMIDGSEEQQGKKEQ